MEKKLRDAIKRFIKLYKERKNYRGDVGYVSITEELQSVGIEIAKLTADMIKEGVNKTVKEIQETRQAFKQAIQ